MWIHQQNYRCLIFFGPVFTAFCPFHIHMSTRAMLTGMCHFVGQVSKICLWIGIWAMTLTIINLLRTLYLMVSVKCCTPETVFRKWYTLTITFIWIIWTSCFRSMYVTISMQSFRACAQWIASRSSWFCTFDSAMLMLTQLFCYVLSFRDLVSVTADTLAILSMERDSYLAIVVIIWAVSAPKIWNA